MRRALKFLFVFLGLVIAAVIAAVILIPREQIVALAADQIRAATGRELTISGELSPSFWPVFGVRTGAITLSNAEWAQAENMVSASAVEIGVRILPLLSGEIHVTKLRLVDPVVALEINGDGHPNWEFGDGAAAASGTSGGAGGSSDDSLKISLPEAVISNGKISFSDTRTGQHFELSELDLTAGLESLDAPLKLNGSGMWNGKRATVEALVDTPSAAMSGAKTLVQFSLTSEPATFSFEGDLKMPKDAALPLVNGNISADLPNPSAAVTWATGAGAPAGLADIGAVKLTGSVAATDAALQFATNGNVVYKGRAVSFDLKADGAEGWLDSQAFTVVISGGSDELFQFSFNGPVSGGSAPAADGPLILTISDLRGLAEWAGVAALDAPAGTMESASLNTLLALQGERIDLSDLTLRLDATSMTGEAGVDLGNARPMITARLNSGPLDLSPFMKSGGDENSGSTAPGQGWSTDLLDLSALRAVDAQVAIRAESVDLGDIEIGRSDINAQLRDGRLDMMIDRVDAYGGGLSGTLTLLAGQEAQLSTDMTVSAVQLHPLLSALADFNRLEGLGAFRIKLDGRGRSMDALMRSLNGNGGLELTDGAILGLNLAAMVRNLAGGSGGDDKTDFSAVTGTFDITNGVLHNTDFTFLGPLIRVIGAGTVDIGGQAQKFRLEPTAVASLSGQGGAMDEAGLSVFPILITGTWSNPSFRLDLSAAIAGFLSNPDKTIGAVTGLINGAGSAETVGTLLGTVTGDDSGGDSLGALNQALGGVLGGDAEETTSSQSGLLGGLLGGLGGSKKKSKSAADPASGAGSGTQSALGDSGAKPGVPDDVSDTQPVPGAVGATSAGVLAPKYSPMPAPARRQSVASLPKAATGADESVTDEALPQVTPEPEPTEPAAAIPTTPEPAPQPAAASESEPEPAKTKTKQKKKKGQPKAKDDGAGKLLQGNLDKDGGLTPADILKSFEK